MAAETGVSVGHAIKVKASLVEIRAYITRKTRKVGLRKGFKGLECAGSRQYSGVIPESEDF